MLQFRVRPNQEYRTEFIRFFLEGSVFCPWPRFCTVLVKALVNARYSDFRHSLQRMKSTRSTTCDLRDQANAAVHGYRNVLFSESGGCVHFHPPGSIYFRLTRKAVVPVHHDCEISEEQRSSFVSDPRNGRGIREPNGPLALGSFEPLTLLA